MSIVLLKFFNVITIILFLKLFEEPGTCSRVFLCYFVYTMIKNLYFLSGIYTLQFCLFGVRINITNDKKKIVPSDMEKRRLENDVY